jgi:hypothetical protein
MTTDKTERRKRRKAELDKLSIEKLNEIKPYKKDIVFPGKTEPNDQTKISKEEMIETILSYEGLGSAGTQDH